MFSLFLGLLLMGSSFGLRVQYRYRDQEGVPTELNLRVCFKCGSTSIAQALYFLEYQEEYTLGHPFVQLNVTNTYAQKSAQLVEPPINIHNVIVYRDPVERYRSAFKFFIRCCPGTFQKCWKSNPDHLEEEFLTNQLPYLLDTSGVDKVDYQGRRVECLTWEEFVYLIHQIEDDPTTPLHFRSQRWYFPDIKNATYIPISEFEETMHALHLPVKLPLRRYKRRTSLPNEWFEDGFLRMKLQKEYDFLRQKRWPKNV